MPTDKYANFTALAAHEKNNRDYRIRKCDRKSRIVIVAPHGGNIEPKTSEIAESIAAEIYSLYCFEGLREKSKELHITSTNFDEPIGRGIVEASEIAVGVHGRADNGDGQAVWLGGLDFRLRDAVGEELKRAGILQKTTGHHFEGKNPDNICNRGRSGKGIQLEIPNTLRKALTADTLRLQAFVAAVHSAIKKIYV